MPKINPWQAIVALAILVAVPIVLVLTGHKTDLGFVVAGAGSLILAVLNVFRPAPDPNAVTVVDAPKPPPITMGMLFVLMLVGCGAPSSPTPITIAGAGCVSHRTALQLACVDTYSDKASIDACRLHVQQSIECITVTVSDGGAE